MLDAISEGWLDVGFARAFLSHAFRPFGRSPDVSVGRFREGVEQVGLLSLRRWAEQANQEPEPSREQRCSGG